MNFLNSIWLIPLFPLFGAAIMLFFGRSCRTSVISFICPGAIFVSSHLRRRALSSNSASLPGRRFTKSSSSSGCRALQRADWGFLLDPLSSVMILVVTGVGFLIHVYSVGYMAHEGGYYRFFGYLNLFVFFMLMLVLANNYALLFVGWEGVGLCSYLLIGFYFQKKSAGDAGKKAFIVNRIGDAAFIIGMLLIFSVSGSVRFIGGERTSSQSAALHARNDRLRRPERHGAAVVHRRHRQIGAVSPVCLAARRHGRSDAGFRADPRGHHGDGRRLHGGALARAVRVDPAHLDHRCGDRRVHGNLRGLHRAGAERYQARAGLLDRQPAWLHVPGAGRRRVLGRHLPPVHARFLQGSALPRRRLRDSRHGRRAGHAPHGRPQEVHAHHALDHVRRVRWRFRASPAWPASSRKTKSWPRSTDRALGSKPLYVVGLVTALMTAFYMWRLMNMTFYGEQRVATCTRTNRRES